MLHKISLPVLLLVYVLCWTVSADAFCPPAVHGDILEVFPEQNKIRVLTDDGMTILELDPNCEIFRGTQEISVYALRPVAEGYYQDGLFLFNASGQVMEIFVNYSMQEEAGYLVFYDIFGEIKMREPL